MKKPFCFIVILLSTLFLQAVSEKNLIDSLQTKYRTWIQEEVVYIITPIEKEMFLKLDSDALREAFIKAFWEQRNPNPNLPENEFKKEHYRRIAYANNWYGRESPTPGWRTDMGRIYIILGEPKSIEKIENETGIYPMQIWFYQGTSGSGLPNGFNVVFFKKEGIGEFELYSPVRNGPQSLLENFSGDQSSYKSAYKLLLEYNPQIAPLALSLIPGENTGYSPSLASELLIQQKIPQAPTKKVNTLYAQKMFRFKDMVEVDYSANYIENAKLVAIIRDNPSGTYFVHFLIEPKRLSIERYEQKYFANLDIFGSVSDSRNKTIFQINKTVPLQLSEEQIVKVKDKLFSYQDLFPLIPGKYKLTLLVKNTVSKEFTSIESDIEVPEKPIAGIATLLLANKLIENSSYRGQSKPFLIGDKQLVPSPRNDFLASDTLSVFLQIGMLDSQLKAGGLVQFDILGKNGNVLSFIKKISEYPRAPDIIEKIPLAAFKPDNYVIHVSLLAADRKVISSREENFYVTPMSVLPRPWIVSVPQPSTTAPNYWNDLGNQYLNLNQIDRARPLMERAFHMAPQNPRYADDYCRALMMLKEYTLVHNIALPLFKSEHFEFALTLARAAQAQSQYAEAIDYYLQYISHFSGTPNILNALGECYLGSGNAAEAQKAWEKSLDLNPNQPGIKEKIAGLKKNSQ